LFLLIPENGPGVKRWIPESATGENIKKAIGLIMLATLSLRPPISKKDVQCASIA